MTITSRLYQALKLVKVFELFHARATPQDGGFVIGYGHTASAREGAAVTREEAEDLLVYDLGQIGKLLDAWVYAPLHDNQRQALIAFGFNVGAENLHKSTALRRLNAGDYMGCAREIERWRMAELAGRGQVVDALVRRRAAEKALFLTPAQGFLKTDSSSLRPRFDGDRSSSATTPEPPMEPASAAMTAAHNVSARLRALLPDIEAPAQAAPAGQADFGAPLEAETEAGAAEPVQPELDLAPDAPLSPPPLSSEASPHPSTQALAESEAPVSVPDRDAEAEAAFLDSIVLEPIQLEPAPPAWSQPASPSADIIEQPAPPPPPPFVASPRPRGPRLVSANDYVADAFSDETPPHAFVNPAVEPAQPDAGTAASSLTLRERLTPLVTMAVQRGGLLLGLLGALLFVFSILLILTGKPSIVNLGVGLVGVLCMTPAAYTLLGSRSRD